MYEKHKEAQLNYCKENSVPHFAPKNGFCHKCGASIYKDMTVEEAGSELITSCSSCNASFVE